MDNRREFYRLNLFGSQEVTIIHNEGKEKGEIRDISVTGLSFEMKYEIHFVSGVLLFKLDEKEFQRKATLVRKKELETGKIFYATSFYGYTEKERQQLFQALMKIDLQKRLGRGNN